MVPSEGGKASQPPIRLGLTVSGAVALGAYEGGALAALLVAVQSVNEKSPALLRVDAMGGASAGSITALLAARVLLAGLDPVYVMQQAWVEQDSITNLRTHDPHAPLSIEKMRDMAVQLLDPSHPDARGYPQQNAPIRVDMALACLRGLTYRTARLHGEPVEATTFLDWGTFTLSRNQSASDFLVPEGASPLEFALASGANEFGFPPRLLNRKKRPEDLAQLAKIDLVDPPQDWPGDLWYTDGGTINNEPLGRTFDMVNDIDAAEPGPYARLHLLVHPHPTAHPPGAAWMDPKVQPGWTSTLIRGDHIQRTQSLFADFRNAEKTNSRIEWAGLLREAAKPLLEADPGGLWKKALVEAVGAMEGQKQAIDDLRADAAAGTSGGPAEGDVIALFDRALDLVTGLGGKQQAEVHVVSPLILPEAATTSVEKMLAGEFLGHFGGFLDRKLRMSDFVLGYRSMETWINAELASRLPSEAAEHAVEAVAARHEGDWGQYHFGEETLSKLPLREKLDFARLVAHVSRVAIGELIRPPHV